MKKEREEFKAVTADFSMEACMEAVDDFVELGVDPFEELGRSIIRAEQDVFFNKTMIEAWKEYIRKHDLKWDDRKETYK